MSASTAALGTYELLEGILTHLAFQGLKKAQSVCRDWFDISKRSLGLRQSLFLAPAPIGPLLLWTPDGVKEYYPSITPTTAPDASNAKVIATVHLGLDYRASYVFKTEAEVNFIKWVQLPGPICRPDSKREHALIMQPPCKTINLRCNVNVDCTLGQEETEVLHAGDGLRLGDVVAKLQEMIRPAEQKLRERSTSETFQAEVQAAFGWVYGFVMDDSKYVAKARQVAAKQVVEGTMAHEGDGDQASNCEGGDQKRAMS